VEPGTFANLVDGNQIPRLLTGISDAVMASFRADRMPGLIILTNGVPRITDAEKARRVKLCVNIFKVLRGDMGWSLEKIVDHLPKYLRAELNGEPWEPAARAGLWTTG
jgi:hypothetical protein